MKEKKTSDAGVAVTDRVVYTVKEVTMLLHTSPQLVYKLISLGLLPALKLGSIRVRTASLEEFLEKYEGYDLSNPEDICKLIQDEKNPEKVLTA